MSTESSGGQRAAMRWHGAGHLAALLLLAILLKIPLANCTCGDIPETDTPEWQVAISDAEQRYTGRSVGEATDGDLFLAGTTTGDGNGERFYLMRRTPGGQPRWEVLAESPAYGDGVRVAAHPDGGAVLFYNTLESAGETRSGNHHLDRFDDNGNIQWTRSFGNDRLNFAVDVVVLEDGFALLGRTATRGGGGVDFELFRADAEGTIRWSRTYGGAANDWAVDLEATADGGFAMLGYTESMSADTSRFLLVKTDAEGEEQWNADFGIAPENYAGGLVQREDGGFFLAGTAFFNQALPTDLLYFRREPYLVRTTDTGNLVWERVLSRDMLFDIRGVVAVEGGGFALTGSVADRPDELAAPCYIALLLEVTETGEYVRDRGYGVYTGTDGYQIIQTQDQNFVVVGTANDLNRYDGDLYTLAYLAKVAREGTR